MNSLQTERGPREVPRHSQCSNIPSDQTPVIDSTNLLTAAMKKIESSQARLEEMIGRRLQQVDQDQAALANGICTLEEQYRSLQSET